MVAFDFTKYGSWLSGQAVDYWGLLCEIEQGDGEIIEQLIAEAAISRGLLEDNDRAELND